MTSLASLMPFAEHLGIEIAMSDPARPVGRLDWSENICTAGGVMHGGALMTLADSVGAAAAHLALPDGSVTATISSSTQLMRAITGGTATATAEILHRGRSQIVVRTEIRDDRGQLATVTTQAQAILLES